jgi:hypothetical protein
MVVVDMEAYLAVADLSRSVEHGRPSVEAGSDENMVCSFHPEDGPVSERIDEWSATDAGGGPWHFLVHNFRCSEGEHQGKEGADDIFDTPGPISHASIPRKSHAPYIRLCR